MGVERFTLLTTRKLLENQLRLLIKTLTSATANTRFSTSSRYFEEPCVNWRMELQLRNMGIPPVHDAIVVPNRRCWLSLP